MSLYGSILKHSATYSVAIVLGKMAGVFMLPVYTRYLTTADYGVMELLDLTGFILASLFGARLTEAFFYYHNNASDEAQRRACLSTAFLGAHVCGLIVAACGWFAAAPASRLILGSAQYELLFRLVFVNFAFSFPQEVGFGYLRTLNRSRAFVVLQLTRMALTVGANVVLLVYFDLGVAALFWSNLAASILFSAGMAAYAWRHVSITFEAALFRRMIGFSLPLGVSSLGMTVMHSGDRYFLRGATTLEDIGVYAIAYKLGMMVGLCQLAFIQYWSSQMFAIAKLEDAGKHYVRICTYYCFTLAVVGLGLSLFARPVIELLTTPAFHRAAPFVPLIALAYVIRGLGDYLRSVFSTRNQTGRNVTVTSVGVIATLLACATLIPIFKLWGAVYATLISFCVMTAAAYWQAQRVEPHRFEWGRLLRLLLAGLMLSWIAHHVVRGPVALQFTLAAVCYAGFPILLWLLRFFSPGEKEALAVLWRRWKTA